MKEKIKIYYRSNLKMSSSKLAAQCSHATLKLMHECDYFSADIVDLPIIVLGLSDNKYFKIFKEIKNTYEVIDAGKTELKPNTRTCFAFIEEYE